MVESYSIKDTFVKHFEKKLNMLILNLVKPHTFTYSHSNSHLCEIRSELSLPYRINEIIIKDIKRLVRII